MTSPAQPPEEWGKQFENLAPTYDGFTERLEDLFRTLLARQEIDFVAVDSRRKTVSSFVEKIRRRRPSYSNPLSEISDLCGVRIITHFPHEVEQVCDLIETEFVVDADRSIDKTIHAPREFGYMSKHYVVRIGTLRRQLAEWEVYKDLYAEVQVRTALQHAWAAVEHKLSYKASFEVPQEVTRGFSRISALLEVADIEFARLLARKEELEIEAAEKVSAGDLESVELTMASLDAYLSDTDLPKAVGTAAMERGQLVANFNSADEKQLELDKGALLKLAIELGLRTVGELDERVAAGSDEIANRIVIPLKALTDSGEPVTVSAHDLIGLFLAQDDNNPSAGAGLYDEVLLSMLSMGS